MNDYKGNVARLLKQVWIYDGVVSSAAFNLRPQIHETYISVLRSEMESFADDIRTISRELPATYALMDTEDIKALKTEALKDDIKYNVKPVDYERIKSHAGIFITINGQRLVGGEPFESLELKRGLSADCILLEIRNALAKLASKRLEIFKG